MASTASITGAAHPAPHRHRISLTPLLLILFGVPLLWGISLAANYAMASHFCFPGDFKLYSLPNWLGWVWPLMLALDGLTIIIAITAAVVSYRDWRVVADENAGPRSALIELGEGRTRFLSAWALLVAVLFTIGTAFELVAMFVVPVCG